MDLGAGGEWIGIVFGYICYIYPGVVANRQLKRWQANPDQPPWLAWIIGSVVVFFVPIALVVGLIGVALGVPTSQ